MAGPGQDKLFSSLVTIQDGASSRPSRCFTPAGIYQGGHRYRSPEADDAAIERRSLASASGLCSAHPPIGASLAAPASSAIHIFRTSAIAARCARRCRPDSVPIVRRILKFPGPDADLRYLGAIFLFDIIERVFPEGDRLPLLNHPAADIDATFDRAQPHHAAISIRITPSATHLLAPDPLAKCLRHIEAARVAGAVFRAELRYFRRVDAPKADALVVDLDGVTIDDTRRPLYQVASACVMRQQQADQHCGNELHT